MDSLKKPETILSLSTAVGLGAASYYFNKKLNALQEKYEKLEEAQVGCIDELSEIKTIKSHMQLIANNQSKFQHELSGLRMQFDDFLATQEQIESNIQSIIKALNTNGIEVPVIPSVRRQRGYSNNNYAPNNGMGNNPYQSNMGNNGMGNYQPNVGVNNYQPNNMGNNGMNTGMNTGMNNMGGNPYQPNNGMGNNGMGNYQPNVSMGNNGMNNIGSYNPNNMGNNGMGSYQPNVGMNPGMNNNGMGSYQPNVGDTMIPL